MSTLAQNIKRRRKELDMAPAKLVEGTDISLHRWKDIEAGRVDPTTGELEAICNVLRTTPSALMGWHPNGTGIIQRMDRTSFGYGLSVEFDKNWRIKNVVEYPNDGYIRIDFEEVKR